MDGYIFTDKVKPISIHKIDYIPKGLWSLQIPHRNLIGKIIFLMSIFFENIICVLSLPNKPVKN